MQKPVVLLANEGFVIDGRSAASCKGIPGLRIVSETVPCECSVQADADAGIHPVMDQIICGLVQPLTDEEKSPKSKEKANPARIIFKGEFAEVNRFFYKSGWGDGLPLAPPTEEAVQEMLSGTDLPPEHIIGKVQPRLGKATVEKVAINAVMAGALPTHMPILIAAVEHLLDPDTRFGTFSMSTGSWAPFWVINGPIRNDVHVNSSSGAMSPGNIANAAIGRAMGLIIKNLGGIRKGVEDMGVIGNPGKYSMVIGENEENSPWEPLHVDAGFDRNDSTVSLIFPNSFTQTWPYSSDDLGIIRTIIYNIKPVGGLGCFVIPPGHAKILAQAGWTKERLRAYIVEYARNPAFRHHSYYDTNNALSRRGYVPMSPMDSIAAISDANHIRIVVAGGPGTFMGLVFSAPFPGAKWVSKKIQLPANWKKLTAKYRNLVPTYERY